MLFSNVAPNDFTAVNGMELRFQPTSSSDPQCSDIQISVDDVLESTEGFHVILSTPDTAVLLMPNTIATVDIMDNDRKYKSSFKPKILLQ